MRKFKNYQLVKEDYTSQHEAGRYNPAREIVYKIRRKQYIVTLSCGDSDSISVYRENDILYVLTTNYRYDYCGLEVISKGQIIGDIFFQAPEEEIGRNWSNKADYTLIRILNNYIY